MISITKSLGAILGASLMEISPEFVSKYVDAPGKKIAAEKALKNFESPIRRFLGGDKVGRNFVVAQNRSNIANQLVSAASHPNTELGSRMKRVDLKVVKSMKSKFAGPHK